MRKTITAIIFLIIIFVVNLIFYYLSDDYKFFLRKIKNTNDVVYLEEKVINDDEINNIDLENKKEEEKILEWAEVVELSKKNEKIFELKDNDSKVALKDEVVLWDNYMEINKLFSLYSLNKLEINSNLFDITDEYPDNYFEYYSKDLTLYFFPTKTYDEILDIFSVLDDELPFTLKEVNNFWDNSFYINLNENIKDRFVRLVISNKWVVFWLKIKKTEYNLVKDKLNSLRIIPEEKVIVENESLQIEKE